MTTKATEAKSYLLKGEEYGNPISEKLSNYLRKYTDKNDRQNVSINTGVGYYTIRNVISQSNTLTKDNSKAIIKLIQVAIEKCTNSIDGASEAIEELQLILEPQEND